MRVNEASALVSSVSKLTRNLLEGRNHTPKSPACSWMGVSEVSPCPGITSVQEPSALLLATGQVTEAPVTGSVLYGAGGVRPFWLLGKKTNVPVANVASAMPRLR